MHQSTGSVDAPTSGFDHGTRAARSSVVPAGPPTVAQAIQCLGRRSQAGPDRLDLIPSATIHAAELVRRNRASDDRTHCAPSPGPPTRGAEGFLRRVHQEAAQLEKLNTVELRDGVLASACAVTRWTRRATLRARLRGHAGIFRIAHSACVTSTTRSSAAGRCCREWPRRWEPVKARR